MAKAALTSVDFVKKAVKALAVWRRVAAEAEAKAIEQEDEALLALHERVRHTLSQVQTALGRFNGQGLEESALLELQRYLKLISDGLRSAEPFRPSDQLIELLRHFTDLLETRGVSGAAGGDFATALTIDEINDAISVAMASVEWSELEARIGVPIPGSVREKPFDLSPGPDRFDGQVVVSIVAAIWADPAVRNGMQQWLHDKVLPAIRRDNGHGAIREVNTEGAEAETTVCRVLFGTNRQKQNGAYVGECAEGEQALTFGRAGISVPKRRKRGSIPRPSSGLLPEVGKHMQMAEPIRVLSLDEFRQEVKSGTSDKGAFLFVHGYNTTFEGGLYRTAQLAIDLEVERLVLHYAWPSAGALLKYDTDSENVKISRSHFKAFVREIIEQGITNLSIVAHSKGNELVLEAFHELNLEMKLQKQAGQLVLASPDVDVKLGKERLKTISAFFQTITLYANAHDVALIVSALKAGRRRLGGRMSDRHPFITQDVDSIDAADAAFEWFGLNHDAYVDAPVLMYDLLELLKSGRRPPNERSSSIRPKDCKRGRYYKIVTR